MNQLVFDDISSCAALLLYLESNDSTHDNTNSQNPRRFKRNFHSTMDDNSYEDLVDLTYFIMGHKIFQDYEGSDLNFTDFSEIHRTIVFNQYLNEYEVNDSEFQDLIIRISRECLPQIINEQNEIVEDLNRFKRKVIRRLSTIPSSD